MSAWRVLLTLAGIMVVALALRVPRLGLEALTSDESFSWRIVHYPLGEMLQRATSDVHPPLHYLLLRAWITVAGDSLLAMRSLSVLLGVFAVAAAWAVCAEAMSGALAEDAPPPRSAARAAGLLAALLVALHPGQIDPSRNARMYTQGVLLVGLSTWLLLRALRGRSSWTWLAYAVATVALCYTHYYGFFSVVAQVVAVGVEALRRRRGAGTEAWRLSRSFALAGLGAAALFAPWLPFFWQQARTVEADYWIPSPSGSGIAAALLSWSSGQTLTPATMAARGLFLVVALLLLALATAWGARRGGRPARFLLLQAAMPWLASLGLALLTGRSLFLERYFVFAQLFYLAFWAAVAGSLQDRWPRRLLGAVLVTLLLPGVVDLVSKYPTTRSNEALAAQLVQERAHAGDLVITDSARALNRLRLLLSDLGARAIAVKCTIAADDALPQHYSHAPSLAAGDLVSAAALTEASWQRLWWVAGVPADDRLGDAWRPARSFAFRGAGSSRHLVTLYLRAAPVKAP